MQKLIWYIRWFIGMKSEGKLEENWRMGILIRSMRK